MKFYYLLSEVLIFSLIFKSTTKHPQHLLQFNDFNAAQFDSYIK